VVVPKNCWFAADLINKTGFALAGCTVAPGFHFDDFEMADDTLCLEFLKIKSGIIELIKK